MDSRMESSRRVGILRDRIETAPTSENTILVKGDLLLMPHHRSTEKIEATTVDSRVSTERFDEFVSGLIEHQPNGLVRSGIAATYAAVSGGVSCGQDLLANHKDKLASDFAFSSIIGAGIGIALSSKNATVRLGTGLITTGFMGKEIATGIHHLYTSKKLQKSFESIAVSDNKETIERSLQNLKSELGQPTFDLSFQLLSGTIGLGAAKTGQSFLKWRQKKTSTPSTMHTEPICSRETSGEHSIKQVERAFSDNSNVESVKTPEGSTATVKKATSNVAPVEHPNSTNQVQAVIEESRKVESTKSPESRALESKPLDNDPVYAPPDWIFDKETSSAYKYWVLGKTEPVISKKKPYWLRPEELNDSNATAPPEWNFIEERVLPDGTVTNLYSQKGLHGNFESTRKPLWAKRGERIVKYQDYRGMEVRDHARIGGPTRINAQGPFTRIYPGRNDSTEFVREKGTRSIRHYHDFTQDGTEKLLEVISWRSSDRHRNNHIYSSRWILPDTGFYAEVIPLDQTRPVKGVYRWIDTKIVSFGRWSDELKGIEWHEYLIDGKQVGNIVDVRGIGKFIQFADRDLPLKVIWHSEAAAKGSWPAINTIDTFCRQWKISRDQFFGLKYDFNPLPICNQLYDNPSISVGDRAWDHFVTAVRTNAKRGSTGEFRKTE